MKYPIRRVAGAMVAGLLTTTAWQAAAQDQTQICEDDQRFHQFDFWIGEWTVTNNANGNFAGENSIQPAQYGCVLIERWHGRTGTTGQSINFYDPLADEWRQVWIANGYSIDYTGGLDEEGSMVLVGEIHYYRQDQSVPFRGRWTPNEDGSVRQFFEQYDAETDAWQVWFDGHYVRREEGDADEGH